MTNKESIIGLAKKLKDNPILKEICEHVAIADSDSHLGELIADARLDTDAANFASNIPALAESLILAYEALEAASEYVCDPDELPPMMMTSEYRPPITQEERLLDEIERVKRKKAVAKQIRDALSSLNA